MFVFENIKKCFEFGYETFSGITIYGNASIFDVLIAMFVGTLIPVLIATTFGGRGIATAVSSTVEKSESIADRKLRESYAYYEANRARNDAYNARYSTYERYHANRARNDAYNARYSTYDRYKSNRSRSEAYSARYQAEKEAKKKR